MGYKIRAALNTVATVTIFVGGQIALLNGGHPEYYVYGSVIAAVGAGIFTVSEKLAEAGIIEAVKVKK